MAEIYCMGDCTSHDVELEDTDKITLAEMFGGIDISHITSTYNESTKAVVITLKEM